MKSDTRSFYTSAVEQAVHRIFGELDDALDLADLARSAALSPLHFHRVFRGLLGETPLELHRRLRLERAAHELVRADAPVTRIAFEAGYETHESFTRAFGERYALSPTAFRQKSVDASASSGCLRPPDIELPARSGLHFRADHRTALSLVLSKGDSTMHVELKPMPALRVAAVRHVGPYNRISEAFARLGEIAAKAGLVREGTEMLALYYDDAETTPADQLRADAALTVANDVELPSGLTEIRIPPSRYAWTTHIGPYTGLGDAWARFMGTWLPQSGHRVGPTPSFEIYRNTPGNASPEALRTEMYLPIA